LSRATQRLRLPVQVCDFALSDRAGSADLFIPDDRAFASLVNGTGARMTVRTRTLDDLRAEVSRTISFVKIDVEGHELAVLRGGVRCLDEDKPTILVEIEERHSRTPMSETFDFLLSRGYRGSFLDFSGCARSLPE